MTCRVKGFFRYGVTLVEVAFTTAIVGLGSVAILQFAVAATSTTGNLNHETTALSVARAGHEWAANQAPEHLLAQFDATGKYTPTSLKDAQDNPLCGTSEGQKAYQSWGQRFALRHVEETNLTATAATGSTSRCYEITVTAMKGTTSACSLSRLYVMP